MVSENPFSEPTIPSEQKTSSSFLGPDKSFKTPVRNFVKMAQVDSLTQQNINENEKLINTNDSDDCEVNSDIELTIEESDDKETVSETEDAAVSQKNKNLLSKDTESLESLDNDLANTAHLVGTGFSADEFDQIDCLDAIDDSANGVKGGISKLVPPLTELDDRGQSCDSSKSCVNTSINGDVKCVDRTQTNDVNDKNEERTTDSPRNQQQVDASPVKVGRNNNTTKKIDENEKPADERFSVQPVISSEQLPKKTVMKVESVIVQRNDPTKILPKQEALEDELLEEFRLEINSCSDDDQSQDSVSQQPLFQESDSITTVRSQNNDSERVEAIPTQSEKHAPKPTETIHVPAKDDRSKENETALVGVDEDTTKSAEAKSALVENDASKKIGIDEDSAPSVVPVESADKPDQNGTDVLGTVKTSRSEKDLAKQVEKMSAKSDSTSEAISNKNSTSGSEKSTVNQNSNQVEEMLSIDDDSSPEVIPIVDVEKSNENCPRVVENPVEASTSKKNEETSVDTPSKIVRNDDISKSSETRTASIVEDITDHCTSVQSNSIQSSITENRNIRSYTNDVTLQNDDLCTGRNLHEAQVANSPDVVHSPMIVDDNIGPESVESNDIIIDSVESEIVEVDADDEPVILDDDLGEDVSYSVSRTSQQKFNQLFENTAKEIAHDHIGAEVVVGNDDPIPSTSGITNEEYKKIEISLNRLTPSDNDSRKRRLETNQNDSSLKDPLFVGKRARISESDSSDRCNDYPAGTNSTERRKKPPANRARKHTSSTNVDKTFQEIEKKIRDSLDRQNKSREPSPNRDLSEEYDLEIRDNDGDISNDAKCSEAAQNSDNNSRKIKLNYHVISKDNLKNVFKVMRTKLSRKQLETMMIQKCCEMISDSNEIGSLRRQVADLQQAEMFRKQKILNLEKQISQLKAVCQRYLDQVKENADKTVTPIKITRSVGLQVALGDSSPYVNFEPTPVVSRNQEKLKKLLSAPPMNGRKPSTASESPKNVTRLNAASPLPSNTNSKNHDPRLVNGNVRISSPLSSSSSPTPNSSPSIAGSSRNNMKIAKSANVDAPVIDLTDKDDRNESEGNVAAKNLLATVNGTVVTYVPVKVNSQDQNRQVIKPGTPILVNGQLMTISAGKFPPVQPAPAQHPAPVPPPPPMVMVPGAKPVPPRPMLKIERSDAGIMLSWEFPRGTVCAEVSKYQLFAYQETDVPPRSDLWKAVGDVSALPLPMACTLTQFLEGFKYHFIVRAVDTHNRYGMFSIPRTITL